LLSCTLAIAESGEQGEPPPPSQEVSSDASHETSPQALYDEAIEHLTHGDRDAALRNFRAIRELDEELADKLWEEIPVYIPRNLEECFEELKKFLSEETIELFRSREDAGAYLHHGFGTGMRNSWGLWRGSRLSEYFNDRGVFHPDDMSAIIMDEFQDHLSGEEYVEEKPEFPREHYVREHYMQELERVKDFLRRYPESEDADQRLGEAYAALEKWKKATRHLKECLRQEPKDIQCNETLARVYVAQGMREEAIDILEKGLKIFSYDPDWLRLIYGHMYAEEGDWKSALAQYEKIDDEWQRTMQVGFALYNLERYEEALRHFKKWVEMDHHLLEAHFHIGLCHVKQGNRSDALKVHTWISMIDDDKAQELLDAIEAMESD
jgi:tetratricopeptide (TPR) repeat protein